MKPSHDLKEILDVHNFHTTKDKAEFVVTRYDESLDWLKGLEHLATIYNKGANDLPYDSISVPNYGCGLETMLRHIITRYNSLADMTMFCQGTLADRADQPLYPLSWYFDGSGVKGYLTDAYDVPKSRYRSRLTDPLTFSNRTLTTFREKVVGIPYKYLVEMWVRGDWISVSREAIHKKPYQYYCHLYEACKFERGVLVEECWFLERSWYSIFTSQLHHNFKYSSNSNPLLQSPSP